jgi:hypothetical protein
MWTEGNFVSAIRSDGLFDEYADVDTLLAITLSAIQADQPVQHSAGIFAGKIGDLIKKIVVKKTNAEEAYLDLIRMANNLPSSSMGTQLRIFAESQMTPQLFPKKAPGL